MQSRASLDLFGYFSDREPTFTSGSRFFQSQIILGRYSKRIRDAIEKSEERGNIDSFGYLLFFPTMITKGLYIGSS